MGWGTLIKFAVVGAILLAVGLTIQQGFALFKRTQQDLVVARVNEGVTKTALETEKATSSAYKKAAEDMVAIALANQAALDRLASIQAHHLESVTKLQATFDRHDLEKLSDAKPKLVERIINDGTARALERLQQAGTFDRDGGGGGGAKAPDLPSAPAAGSAPARAAPVDGAAPRRPGP